MASLQQLPSGIFYILFRFGGSKYRRSLKTKQRRQALALKARLEDTTELVNSGRIELPDSVDVPTFLLADGKLACKPSVRESRMDELFERYFASLPEGSLEPGTVYMMKMHGKTLQRIIGKRFSLKLLCFNDLQRYVNKRSEDKGIRGKPLNASTIQKEIATLRGLWKWAAASEEIPSRDFPSAGLRYPKVHEVPPFQTFSDVSRQTQHLGSASSEFKELWATVFLDRDEVEELLDQVQKNAKLPFVYPMFVFAAHTRAASRRGRRQSLRRESGGRNRQQ